MIQLAKKEKLDKIKKPFYKKWWFWVIAVLVVFGWIGAEDAEETADADVKKEEHKTEEKDKHTAEKVKSKDFDDIVEETAKEVKEKQEDKKKEKQDKKEDKKKEAEKKAMQEKKEKEKEKKQQEEKEAKEKAKKKESKKNKEEDVLEENPKLEGKELEQNQKDNLQKSLDELVEESEGILLDAGFREGHKENGSSMQVTVSDEWYYSPEHIQERFAESVITAVKSSVYNSGLKEAGSTVVTKVIDSHGKEVAKQGLTGKIKLLD